MFAAILGILLSLLGMHDASDVQVQFIAPIVNEDVESFEWSEFYVDAFEEYADEFTALFNATEVKWSKNGRLMIRPVGAKSFKFAKKGN